ncbi:hypothetical protein [uncultured Dysosmobacter sp.]|uniref:hypothetical protein n=1 Tax=uncultured Dysosmobacter sp. TaxID=2591384 RepID=UPI00260BF21E|nr:hypothetical protein [uncultured Dysosmobacter sp.]
MNIQNCPLCGKLFDRRGVTRVCPSCTEALREDLKTVQAYMDANPSAKIREAAQGTGVDIDRLRILARQGWITFPQD